MIIIGIDPGTATTGWGVVQTTKQRFAYLQAGVITTSFKLALEKRLKIIHTDLKSLLKKYQPDVCVIENLFFNTNAKTALLVGQARGAVLLTVELNKIPLYSYTPLQVKMAITGYGRADKQQMQKMVQSLLKLPEIPRPDDAADALAVALTHGFSLKITPVPESPAFQSGDEWKSAGGFRYGVSDIKTKKPRTLVRGVLT